MSDEFYGDASLIECTQTALVDGDVVVDPVRTPGDIRELMVHSQRSQVIDTGLFDEDFFATTPVELEVLRSVGSDLVLRWFSEPTSFEGSGLSAVQEALIARQLGDVPSPPVDYRLDEFGFVVELVNLEEFRSALIETAQAMSDQDGEVAAAVEEFFRNAPESFLTATATELPSLYHDLDGTRFFEGEVISVVTELPNPLGGPALQAEVSLEVLSVDDPDGCLLVHSITAPDPDSLVDLTLQMIEAVGGDLDEAMAEIEAADSLLQYDVSVLTQIDPASGLLRRTQTREWFEFEEEQRIEITVISDVTPTS